MELLGNQKQEGIGLWKIMIYHLKISLNQNLFWNRTSTLNKMLSVFGRNDHMSIAYLRKLTRNKPMECELIPWAFCSFMSRKASSTRGRWYLDSGCTRHMTENVSYFASLTKINGGNVTYEDNGKDKIWGEGILITLPFTSIISIHWRSKA